MGKKPRLADRFEREVARVVLHHGTHSTSSDLNDRGADTYQKHRNVQVLSTAYHEMTNSDPVIPLFGPLIHHHPKSLRCTL